LGGFLIYCCASPSAWNSKTRNADSRSSPAALRGRFFRYNKLSAGDSIRSCCIWRGERSCEWPKSRLNGRIRKGRGSARYAMACECSARCWGSAGTRSPENTR